MMLTKESIKNRVHQHESILLSVGINIGFFLLLVLLSGFHYELSDDWFFSSNIAEGNYNFTFCNYFIQLLSGLLQKIIYPVNAFMLLQLIFGFVAMTTISYIFFYTFGKKKGFLLILLMESAFAYNIYSMITFSKTAAVLVTAGGLMIFWAYLNKKRLIYSIFGLLLAIIGSFYRHQIFYSVIAVFAFFVLAYIIHQKKSPGIKGFVQSCRGFFRFRMVAILVILVVTTLGCKSISKAIIFSDEELAYYRTYNSLRSSVVDFQIPSFEEESEKYQKLGISENDIEMLRNWYIDDQGVASVEILREISQIQEGRQNKVDYLVNMIISFFRLAELLLLIVYVVVVVGILLVCRKRARLFVGLITAAVALLYGYLFMIGRSNHRSVFSIWFAATVCLLYAVQFFEMKEWFPKKKRFLSKHIVSVCILISIFNATYGIYVAIPSLVVTSDLTFPEFESYIASSENKTFALGRASYLLFRNMVELEHPMIIGENEAFEKCVYFGTPYYAHPRYNRLLREKGIDNLYTALAEKDNLYFVDHYMYIDIGKIVTYLNEQYGEDKYYDSVLVHQVEEFNIYQIVATEKE